MGQHSFHFDWQGFRRLASPERAAGALVALYGAEAALAAAHCGLEAHGAGRDDDFRFWVDVFMMLHMPRRSCDRGLQAAPGPRAVN